MSLVKRMWWKNVSVMRNSLMVLTWGALYLLHVITGHGFTYSSDRYSFEKKKKSLSLVLIHKVSCLGICGFPTGCNSTTRIGTLNSDTCPLEGRGGRRPNIGARLTDIYRRTSVSAGETYIFTLHTLSDSFCLFPKVVLYGFMRVLTDSSPHRTRGFHDTLGREPDLLPSVFCHFPKV